MIQNFVHGAIQLALSIAFFVMTLIVYLRLADKLDKVETWADYSGCVDPYMRVNNYQVEMLREVVEHAATQLAMAVFIFVATFIFFFMNVRICCWRGGRKAFCPCCGN